MLGHSLQRKAHDRSRTARSLAPVGLRNMWVTLGELPIATIAAAVAAIGISNIWVYFTAVGYMPTDMGTVLSAATLSGVLVALYLLSMTLLTFAPAAMRHTFPEHSLSFAESLSAIFVGIFGTLASLAISNYFTCARLPQGWEIASLAIAIASLACIVRGVSLRHKASQKGYPVVAAYLFAVSMMAVASLFVVLSLTEPAHAFANYSQIWGDFLFLVLLILVLMLNAGLAVFASVGRQFVAGFLVVGFLFGPLMFLIGSGSGVPQKIATIIGLRFADPVTLLVPRATCQVALGAATDPKALPIHEAKGCVEGVNRLQAQVELRTGSRLLITVMQINGVAVQPSTLTIPDAGTELLKTKVGASDPKKQSSPAACNIRIS